LRQRLGGTIIGHDADDRIALDGLLVDLQRSLAAQGHPPADRDLGSNLTLLVVPENDAEFDFGIVTHGDIGYHAVHGPHTGRRNRPAAFTPGGRCLVRFNPAWKVSRHKPIIVPLNPPLQHFFVLSEPRRRPPIELASSSPYRAELLGR